MSFKQEKVIVIISEFVNDKREFYPITNVPVEKARFFYKDDDGLFKVMASSDYAVRTELNETRLYITNVEIKEKSTKFQVGYEINFTSSEYETSLPVLSVLVEMYNNLIEDSRTIFNYVKKQCFISDDKTTSLVLPNLPAYTVWCMGENGEMFALPVSELYSKFGEMLNKLKSILADYTESKKEEIRGATFFPHLMEDGTLSWTNDKNKPNPEPVNIKGPAGTIENVTASVNSNTGVPSVKVTMSGTKENRSFDLEFRNLKGDKPIKGTDYYTQQEKEQFTAETLKLVTDEGNKQISLTQAEALKVIEQLKKLVEGNPETSNAQTLSGKTRVEFENDVSNSFKYHFKKVIPVEETLQDGYLISNGNYDNTNNYHSKTLTFKCQDGEMFLYKGEGRGDAQSYLMKKDNKIISYGQIESRNEYVKVQIPTGIDTVVFSSFVEKTKEITLDVIGVNTFFLKEKLDVTEKIVHSNKNKLDYLNGLVIRNDYISTEQDGYLLSNGNYDNTSDYHSKTLSFRCQEGDSFLYKGEGRGDAQSYLMKKGNTIVSYGQFRSENKYVEVKIPTGIDTVVFSSFNYKNKEIILDVIKEDVLVKIEKLENDMYLRPKEVTTQDGYLISNGNYDNTNNYHSKTLTFNCQKGDSFLYKGEGRGDAQSYLMKKGNTIVSYGQFRSENKYTKIKIEKDIDNIIFSSFNYKNKEIILDVIKLNASDMNSRISKLEVNFTENILSNKKWAVFGDSFTYGDGVGVFTDGNNIGKNKVYPYHINNRTGIEVIKFFEGGRTLAYPKDGTFTNSITCPTVSYYYQNVPVDVDYITIYLGINDSHHATGSSGTDGEIVTGVIPIGTIDDTDTSTYYGAWNVVLTWLIEHRPFAHIGIIVSNGCDTPEYRTAQLSIAKKYGIPYIDLNGDERTPVMIRSQNQEISKLVRDIITKKQSVDYDGTATGKTNRHPNEEAHLYESYFIENFLRSL